MMQRIIVRNLTLAALAALLSACHGGGGGAIPSLHGGGTGMQPYTGPASLTFGWGQGSLQAQGAVCHAVTLHGTVSLNVVPQLRDEAGLLEYARETADPHSASYRHWLTPREIGEMFGAPGSAIEKAAKYFQSYHLGVGTWPQHLMMVVTGSVPNVEAAFGTKFGSCTVTTPAGVKTFYAPYGTEPHFATALPVVSVVGLVGLHTMHTYIEADFQTTGYTAPTVRNGFDYTSLIRNGYKGGGINIGIIGTGPISSADVPAYARLSGTSQYASVVQKNVTSQPPSAQNNNTGTCLFGDPCTGGVDTGLATPPPTTGTSGTCTSAYTADPSATCNPEDGEAQLDTEQVAGMAPGATVDFYLAFNNQDCTAYPGFCQPDSIGMEGIYLTDDEIQQAIADNLVDVLSLSFGEGDPQAECNSGCYFNASGAGPGPDEFAALAAEGITVFVSSGDNGAYQCDNSGIPATTECASYPATDPSVIAVGGVNAPFTDGGERLLPGTQITSWAENTTFAGDGYLDNSPGSGGGPACCFSAPSWQAAAPIGATKRETPDISLLADPSTGVMIVVNAAFGASGGYGYGSSGGTSAAAPEAAAMFGDFLSACKANATCTSAHGGFSGHGYRWGIAAAPAFYAIAMAQANYGTQTGCAGGSAGAFYDVCAGSNGTRIAATPGPTPTPPGTPTPPPTTIYTGFATGPGYDEVTGLGVPFGGSLAQEMFGYCSCGTLNLP